MSALTNPRRVATHSRWIRMSDCITSATSTVGGGGEGATLWQAVKTKSGTSAAILVSMCGRIAARVPQGSQVLMGRNRGFCRITRQRSPTLTDCAAASRRVTPAGTMTAACFSCMVKRIGSIVALWCVVCAGATRAGEPAQTVNRAAGARYGAGWLRSFFLGAHWREAWETPVEVPVLNLELFDGGLRPDHLSGGFETKNLHFRSGNGNVWAFRSVDKDPTRGLDPDTRDSIVGDYFRDQTSTAQ